jgi:cyclomaltodextrinase / maltogenic alpha-amylase / neopullulanase
MKRFDPFVFVLVCLLIGLGPLAAADHDFSKDHARPVAPWVRNAVVYELYPRSFSAAGNFQGVTSRLGELKELGVDVLWLMPIHPIGEKLRKGSLGSPYAVRDYYGINPEYGTPADLKALVAAAHQRGMKLILDIVLNHSAWDNRLIQEHPEFYKRDAAGQIVPPVPDWSDVAGFNYANPQLRDYMIGMLKHWVTEFGVDGYRCDVASMVPVEFWEQARTALEEVKPEILMLAEASSPELLIKAFDFDYAWPLHSTLNHILLRGAPASDFRRSWEESLRQFPQGALHLRISDNHDEARAVARFGIQGALAASVLMFSLDGIPLLYNGMEVGDATESGAPALFEKLPVFWESKERPPLRDIYRDLIKLRKQYGPFRNDRVIWLRNSNEADLVTLMRLDEKDEFVVAINFSNRPQIGWVEVKNDQQFEAVKITGRPDISPGGFPLFRLSGFEWRIYHRVVR